MKKGSVFKLLLATLLFATGNAGASIQLGFGPPIHTGNSLALALQVTGLNGNLSLSGYDLNIEFDANHLAFAGAEFGDPQLGNQLDLANLGLNPQSGELSHNGSLNLTELSLDSSEDLNLQQADNFTLAIVKFNLLQPGSSQLAIHWLAFADSDGNPLSPIVSGTTVTTVPLPATAWLMLGGLGLMRRQQRR